jgi:hypothetical protein
MEISASLTLKHHIDPEGSRPAPAQRIPAAPQLSPRQTFPPPPLRHDGETAHGRRRASPPFLPRSMPDARQDRGMPSLEAAGSFGGWRKCLRACAVSGLVASACGPFWAVDAADEVSATRLFHAWLLDWHWSHPFPEAAVFPPPGAFSPLQKPIPLPLSLLWFSLEYFLASHSSRYTSPAGMHFFG